MGVTGYDTTHGSTKSSNVVLSTPVVWTYLRASVSTRARMCVCASISLACLFEALLHTYLSQRCLPNSQKTASANVKNVRTILSRNGLLRSSAPAHAQMVWRKRWRKTGHATVVASVTTASRKTQQLRTGLARANVHARTVRSRRWDQKAADVPGTCVRVVSQESRQRGRDVSASVQSRAATHRPVLPGDVARRATSRTAGRVQVAPATAPVQRAAVVPHRAAAAVGGKVSRRWLCNTSSS